MMLPRKLWIILAVGMVVVIGLPALGHWSRRSAETTCSLDGSKIIPIYRVAAVDHLGAAHSFCCLRCAQIWLEHQAVRPRSITVTDEASGEAVDAQKAWYVDSKVVTALGTRNRIHAFRNLADAKIHAAKFAGTIMDETEKPLR